jgi:hypothetical protein
MSRPDPFDLLKRLSPIAREQLRAEDEAQLASILDERVSGESPFALDRRQPRRVAAAAVVVSLVLATAAWVVLRRESVDDPLQVACHREASLDSDRHVVAQAGDPLGSCAAVWATGEFGPGPVPPLTACASDIDLAVVFPGGPGVCSRLGLAELAPFPGDVTPVEELQAQLRAALSLACVATARAVEVVEGALARSALADWEVKAVTPTDDDRPCATFDADPGTRVVSIGARRSGVPVPPASGTTTP